MNVAEVLVACLEEEGVKYIFGVPGEENEALMFALQQSNIRFIVCRHEQGAAFMANVYGRLTGKAGVCLSTLGPGATNLITGLADANLDKAPVIAITAQGGLDRIHHESHQLIDIMKMIQPISKYNGSIYDAQITREIVRKSFKSAQEEKPGVAHIELPESIASETIANKTTPLPVRKHKLAAPNQYELEKAIQIIGQSVKPVIIAGNGAIRNRSSKALTKFAKHYNIPVAETFMGKGALDNDSPQSLFAVGLNFKDFVIEAFEESDVVISIGYDIAEYDPKHWNKGKDKKIIHIDFASSEVYEDYIPEVEIIADIETTINQINDFLKVSPFSDWYTPIRNRILESILHFNLLPTSKVFTVPSVVGVVNHLMDEHTLAISDVGAHKMWIARNLITHSPQSCIISNGLASMGIALPGTIGACLSEVKKNIVAMMGDGGFLMNVQELETAKRLGIAACIIVFVNNDYELISWKQERSRGSSFGTTFDNPNFTQLSSAFGINSYQPVDHIDLENTIKRIWQNQELGIVIVPVKKFVNDEIIQKLENYFKK